MMQQWHRNMMYKRMLKNIQIPGNIWVPFLVGLILGTTMVLFIKLPVKQPTVATSEESISGRNESLEVIIQLKILGDSAFKREILSLHTTPGRVNYEETRQLFLHDVLTEALDNGEPAYYNSNILGRYYRKDYFTCD
jgi:hypothetical protein